MKNLLFGLIAIVLFTFNVNAQEIEKSTVIITKERVAVKSGETEKSARSFLLLNFDQNNNLAKEYNVQGHLFTDDGQKNDLKANDGIYTSVDLFKNSKEDEKNYLMKSDSFKYEDELAQYISVNKFGVKVGCKVRHVRSGYSLLGIDCSRCIGGCIEFYDCEVTVSWDW